MKISVDTVRLNEILASKGLNPNAFAQQSGIHFVTMYRICKGTHAVSPRNARRIADELGVAFAELFKVGGGKSD